MEILKRLLRGLIYNYRTSWEALDRLRERRGENVKSTNMSQGAMLVGLVQSVTASVCLSFLS